MSVHYWYELEPMPRRFRYEPALATMEVFPEASSIEQLRDDLQPWAERRLRESRSDFGLYIADFSAWADDDTQDFFVRALYIVWTGDGPMSVHVEDNSRALRATV